MLFSWCFLLCSLLTYGLEGTQSQYVAVITEAPKVVMGTDGYVIFGSRNQSQELKENEAGKNSSSSVDAEINAILKEPTLGALYFLKLFNQIMECAQFTIAYLGYCRDCAKTYEERERVKYKADLLKAQVIAMKDILKSYGKV